MRRSIAVFGAELEDGTTISTKDDKVVEIRVHPNMSVTVKNNKEDVTLLDKKWVSYTPRTL